ncbi:MAG: DinB family protein [Candidatus Dormibacteraeota bacterium]|nr:DinB family protein [Candidatus Dormibacteraeota bacterium]
MATNDIEDLRRRAAACQDAVAALAPAGAGIPGPPDEETGERWDRLHTLAHTAEMLTFWTRQARAMLDGAPGYGRGEEGYAARRVAIDSASDVGEAELLRQLRAGVDGLAGLLAGLTPADLARSVVYRQWSGEEEVTLGSMLDQMMVGHLEAHLRQLATLPTS